MCKKIVLFQWGRGVVWLDFSQLVSIALVPKLKISHAGFGPVPSKCFPTRFSIAPKRVRACGTGEAWRINNI